MVTKSCPGCTQKIPVACKTCPCGYVFIKKDLGLSSLGKGGADGDDSRVKRRTERIKRFRERTDFYMAGGGAATRQTSNNAGGGDKEGSGGGGKKKRGRPKGSLNKPKSEGGINGTGKEGGKEEDVYANIPAEKAFQYSVSLSEINRKMANQRPLLAPVDQPHTS